MRRVVAIGVFFELALLIVGVTWIGTLAGNDEDTAPAAGQNQRSTEYRIQGRGSGEIVEVELVAQETPQTVAEGVDYQVWTFNGTTPGPVIRVAVGDTVRFTLRNDSTLGLAHSIDFHAAQTAWDVNYQPVQPGETLTFDWVARFPGVFMYHCGVPPVLHHISNGMFGAIIVEPKGLEPAREYVLTSSELYVDDHAHRGMSVGDVTAMEAAEPTYVVFDGGFNRYLDAPLQATPNELIRLWVLNAGPTLTNAFHVIGALFDRTFADGNPANIQYGLQTYNIPPGAGAMFELRIPDPGLYPFVTHSFAYTGMGSVGVIQVTEGAEVAPAEYPAFGDPFTAGVLEFGSTPGLISEGNDGGGSSTHDGPLALDATITGFDPSELEATEGDVEIRITNMDTFDHDFTIDELGTHVVFGAKETIDTTFEAAPGVYTFYCSIPGHRESGMEGRLTVLPGAGH